MEMSVVNVMKYNVYVKEIVKIAILVWAIIEMFKITVNVN